MAVAANALLSRNAAYLAIYVEGERDPVNAELSPAGVDHFRAHIIGVVFHSTRNTSELFVAQLLRFVAHWYAVVFEYGQRLLQESLLERLVGRSIGDKPGQHLVDF